MSTTQLRELAKTMKTNPGSFKAKASFELAIDNDVVLALLDRIKELEDELRACVGSLDFVETTYPLHAGYGVRQHRIETARALLENKHE